MSRLRVFHFSPWADHLENADSFLARIHTVDLAPRVARPDDVELMRKARLDCDWYAESTRCFSELKHAGLEFSRAQVAGGVGLVDILKATRPPLEDWWLIFDGHNPQKIAPVMEKLAPHFKRIGVKILWYAFDEVSRAMPGFQTFAPHVDILIHDEFPLDPAGRALLKKDCLQIHRSWVANILPFSVPFQDAPEDRIVFVGSQLGLTDHRKEQIAFLQREFGDQFVAISDHSLAVADRGTLSRFKVSLCPEGRKFITPAMGMTHTDRPFWSGCMGLVPVSEDSRNGGRLEDLAQKRLLIRYAHGDLDELKRACERALSYPLELRRRIYDHYNQEETVGTVVANALHQYYRQHS